MKHAIWWQVYPLGFTSAEATGEPEAGAGHDPDQDGARPVTHRLGQLTGWLDYAVNLGASGVALGPVFASQTHGYDTTDHYRIDPRLGDEGDFAGLVEAAHARGLRVLLDGVFNHVAHGFPAFQRVLEPRRHGEDRLSSNEEVPIYVISPFKHPCSSLSFPLRDLRFRGDNFLSAHSVSPRARRTRSRSK